MRVRFHTDFERNYQLLINRVEDPHRLGGELKEIVRLLRTKGRLPEKYTTNRLLCKGLGWFECYIYHDKRYCVLIHYKITETYVYLSQIGTPQMLTDAQSIH